MSARAQTHRQREAGRTGLAPKREDRGRTYRTQGGPPCEFLKKNTSGNPWKKAELALRCAGWQPQRGQARPLHKGDAGGQGRGARTHPPHEIPHRPRQGAHRAVRGRSEGGETRAREADQARGSVNTSFTNPNAELPCCRFVSGITRAREDTSTSRIKFLIPLHFSGCDPAWPMLSHQNPCDEGNRSLLAHGLGAQRPKFRRGDGAVRCSRSPRNSRTSSTPKAG